MCTQPQTTACVLGMPILMIRIDDDEYRKLEQRAREHGLLSPEEYVRVMLRRELRGEESVSRGSEPQLRGGGERSGVALRVVEKLMTIIERKVQDMINPFTSKIDENARRLAMLMERIEALEDRVKALEEKIKSLEQSERRAGEVAERRERAAKRRSIAEILREQGVLFESDIANRIRDRDTFFNKLSRVGAIVLELKGERVAIDPEFWKEFIQKLENISTSNEDEVSKILNPKEFRLFERLRESALLYFDATSKRWRLLI